jgi:hypothetical protein
MCHTSFVVACFPELLRHQAPMGPHRAPTDSLVEVEAGRLIRVRDMIAQGDSLLPWPLELLPIWQKKKCGFGLALARIS